MVLKLLPLSVLPFIMFESSVNSDGTQTNTRASYIELGFESSVNSDGTQTLKGAYGAWLMFESSVNSDGTQTFQIRR